MLHFTLKKLLIGLTLFLVVTTIFISVSSSYLMQTQTLIDATLERNESYAKKLASSAELSIQDAQKMLAESARVLSTQFEQPVLTEETNRLLAQSSTFNSISIINENGIIVAVSPTIKNFVGEQVAIGAQETLTKRLPTISKPYEAITGRLIITLTHPIFDESNHYLGYISGAIYLQEENIFSTLMKTHFSQDDSYVFVVDEHGTIIYHQDRTRITDNVSSNTVVQKVLTKQSGASEVTNSKNITMLAGYSFIEGANWGVISQRPFDSTVKPAQEMVMQNFLFAFPFLLIAVVLCIFFASKIAHPIHVLTELTKQNAEQHNLEQLRDVNGWYKEANQLKQTLLMTFTALQSKVHTLQTEATSDALTNLLNRRAIFQTLRTWDEEQTPYVLILIDLDHFKLVNDTYGHQMGDDVLVYFAKFLKQHTMPYHLCGRYGGEEFIILLPNATIEEGELLVETILCDLNNTTSPTGHPITMSAGIARYDVNTDYTSVIAQADLALYNAKDNGRNQFAVETKTNEDV